MVARRKREKSAKELQQEIEFRSMLIRDQTLNPGSTLHWWLMPVPEKIWSSNERTHYRVRSQRVKAWRTMSHLQADALKSRAPVFPLDGKWDVRMKLPFTRRGRRDMSNYVATVVKATVDGLVDAGVWPDDDYRHVRVIEPGWFVQKPQETVEIEVRRSDWDGWSEESLPRPLRRSLFDT